ncbi:MAG: radical SAM protein [Marinilabiliales bacterium]
MYYHVIDYDEPVFRPPSEAGSLILQATLGCSWNRCAFCEMYKTKKFKVRKEEELFLEIDRVAAITNDVRKVFLADGDAMVLSTTKLLKLINKIKSSFPKLQRISAYALPKNINNKTLEELKEIVSAGLKLIYVGIESGDDEVLSLVNKGETFNSTVDALLLAKKAGLRSSVMILTGLGGLKYWEQHAKKSAELLNIVQPEFVSTLVLSFPFGVEHYKKHFKGDYVQMSTVDLLKELKLFITETNLESSVFRSDHASNYLVLKGGLSRDKEKFLKQIDFAIKNPEILRKEWMRGL